MLTLWCGVFGEGTIFSVDLHQNATVESLQEAIVRKKRDVNARFRVDPSKLTLYLARKKGDTTWLKDGLTTDSLLQQRDTAVNAQFEVMRPLRKLYTDELFGRNFVPGEDEIQILVELPPHEDASRKRTREETAPADIPSPQRVRRDKEPYVEPTQSCEDIPRIRIQGSTYVTLPEALLAKCGYNVANDVMLYCRRGVRELWDFVLTKVMQDNAKGFILGPPGVGKSMATLSVLASLDHDEWNVLWIHLSDVYDTCLSMGSNEFWEIDDLSTFELPRVAGKKLVVCLDGYAGTEAHTQFYKRVFTCLDKQSERLVVCSSNATRDKKSLSAARMKNIQYFYMFSWTFDEYVAAIANPTFYGKIASKLDATSPSEVNADTEVEMDDETKMTRALELKFFYAGGSCRHMFGYRTDEVVTDVAAVMHFGINLLDLINYFTSSELHNAALERLFGLECNGGEKWRFPVSAYVASWFAKVSNLDTIKELVNRLYYAPNNAAHNGHILEWLLVSALSRHAVGLADNYRTRTHYLDAADVHAFEPKKPFKVLTNGTIKGNRTWLKPFPWHQGSFDAVFFDKDNEKVIFLQISRSKVSVFRMRFFYQVLCSLRTAGMTIKDVVIFLVVPWRHFDDTEIHQVKDRGLLKEFDAKWKGREEDCILKRPLPLHIVWQAPVVRTFPH